MPISDEDFESYQQVNKPMLRSVVAFALMLRFGRGPTTSDVTHERVVQVHYEMADRFLAQLEEDMKK